MTLRSALLSFRIQRFESTIVIGAAALAVIVSLLVIWLSQASGFARCTTDEALSLTAFCQTSIFSWLDRIARLSTAIVPIFPVVAGFLVGGPIVARELEQGTARLAWSLAPSRLRWFAQRAVPNLVMVTLAGLAVGLVADGLIHLMQPSINLDESFAGFRSRGLLVGVQALLVASVALAFGAILGRSIPTLVLTLILVGGIGIAVDKVERSLLTSEAMIGDGGSYFYGDENLYLESRLRFPDGTILTWEEAYATHPEIQNGWDENSGISDAVLYIPGARYHEVERREAVALLGLAALFIALASVVVIRRRPR
jgi:hypothetical protein